MQCRGVFGEDQNALRARSVQRVQLWKGLHPSALSEAVSHFTMVLHSHYFRHCLLCPVKDVLPELYPLADKVAAFGSQGTSLEYCVTITMLLAESESEVLFVPKATLARTHHMLHFTDKALRL